MKSFATWSRDVELHTADDQNLLAVIEGEHSDQIRLSVNRGLKTRRKHTTITLSLSEMNWFIGAVRSMMGDDVVKAMEADHAKLNGACCCSDDGKLAHCSKCALGDHTQCWHR